MMKDVFCETIMNAVMISQGFDVIRLLSIIEF
jgi:hypothetical protein